MAKGHHRIPVLDGEKNLKHIVSQSAMIKYIYDNRSTLGSKRTMKVKYLDSASGFVVSVLHDEKAIDAFKILKICGVTGVALVNDDGSLMGSLSASDLKKIHSSAKWVPRLFNPVC
jgi:CBS-domain-containing membrane protein